MAGSRLSKNITNAAMPSQVVICKIVKLFTTGFGIKMSSVTITPKEIPRAKLAVRMMKFWKATMFKIVLGLAPIALKIANSCRCSSTASNT